MYSRMYFGGGCGEPYARHVLAMEVMDSGLPLAELVMGPRFARTRWLGTRNDGQTLSSDVKVSLDAKVKR
jgi:hypothetical protein